MVLFVFLMSMIGSVSLIEARRLGVVRRILSTPTTARTVVLGQGIGRFAVAMLQGLTIMIGSALLFGVRWGDPVASGALLTAIALAGAGAGMLIGSTLRTEQQAIPTGLLLGLGLGALGGCMVPVELFPPAMQTIAQFTPQAWAIGGLSQIIRHSGNLADILPQLGVLLAFAIVLTGLATWRLHKVAAR
jgi:ABC-2 type transport system permease protein